MDSCQLKRLFCAPVQVGLATPSMYEAPLVGAERIGVANWASKRRREFAAGRAAARLALSSLGEPARAIPRGPDRAPVWPGGIVGSISHCDGYCAAVLARRRDAAGLGFDVETAEPLPLELQRLIFSPQECAHLEERRRETGVDFTKLGFSAKEAFFKCCYPLAKRFLDFLDASVHFEARPGASLPAGHFRLTVVKPASVGADFGARAIGRWSVYRGFVFTGVTLPAMGATRAFPDTED